MWVGVGLGVTSDPRERYRNVLVIVTLYCIGFRLVLGLNLCRY